MRKIDDKTHLRFITALEAMIKDMDSLGFLDQADELVVSRDELVYIYRNYSKKIDEINHLIFTYYELFDKKHSEYLNASRIRQKEQTRIRRHKQKNSEQEDPIRFNKKHKLIV